MELKGALLSDHALLGPAHHPTPGPLPHTLKAPPSTYHAPSLGPLPLLPLGIKQSRVQGSVHAFVSGWISEVLRPPGGAQGGSAVGGVRFTDAGEAEAREASEAPVATLC